MSTSPNPLGLDLEFFTKFVFYLWMDLKREEAPASGGHLSLLKRRQWQMSLELCHFTSDINPLWPSNVTQRKLRKLVSDFRNLNLDEKTDDQKFEALRQYFFNSKGFSICSKSEINLHRSLFPYVLSSRKGPPEILMLIFTTLCEFASLKIRCLCFENHFLLKVYLNDKPQIIDFSQGGKFLEPYEIVDLVNEGVDFSKDLRNEHLMVRYLGLIKKLAMREANHKILSLTHSYLMRYQPFNLKHLSERAKVAYKTGDFKTAIEDIRSYFLYKNPSMKNIDLTHIYRMARKKQRLNSR